MHVERWKYDQIADALYVRVAPGRPVRQLALSDEVIVDEDADGVVTGVEILNASRCWDLGLLNRLDLPATARSLLELLWSFGGFRTCVGLVRLLPRPARVAHAIGSGEVQDRGLTAAVATASV
jgi:uncharacterized protein YuzE